MQAALKPLRLVKTELAGELETLVQNHHARVFRTARRITGSAADAEDVLPKRFLRLVKGRELTICRRSGSVPVAGCGVLRQFSHARKDFGEIRISRLDKLELPVWRWTSR